MKTIEKNYKLYQLENSVFYRYKKHGIYLYSVEVFKSTRSNNSFVYELISSEKFESNSFIGTSLAQYSKVNKQGISYCKDISLFAAPDEFFKKYNPKIVNESKRSKRNSDRSRKSIPSNSKT